MVNLEWYRTFKAIYEKGTLTAAADALFISQPGVSLHLSSLESYIGSKLFERVSKKMIPTEKGKVLYNALIEPLEMLEEVEDQFQRTTEKNTPTISIGMCFETFQFMLEKYLHTFDFNIVTKFSGYKELLQKLEKGIVDVVVTPQKAETKGIEHIPFSKETIVLVGSKDIDEVEFKKILKKKNNDELLDWLMHHKWYGASSDNEHFKRFWHTNFNKSPNFKQNFIVPNFNSIIRSLGLGTGLAIVPDFLCKDEIEKGNIKILWKGHKRITNQLYFAYRKNTIYKEQIDTIQDIFNKEMN